MGISAKTTCVQKPLFVSGENSIFSPTETEKVTNSRQKAKKVKCQGNAYSPLDGMTRGYCRLSVTFSCSGQQSLLQQFLPLDN